MSNLISEVTLKGTKGPLTVRLSAPPSLALRNEVTYAIIESEPRACGAALGLCSPTQIQKEVPYRGQSVLVYGQAVMDFLLAEGVSWFAALNAGRAAWQHCSAGLIPESEVKEKESFFGGSEES
jgi:hypothetical protein